MKEILSSQYDAVSGGWQDQDGSGHRSSSNGGSGSSNSGGNGGGTSLLSRITGVYNNSPYDSGSTARGFWSSSDTNNTGNGYSGNGTGPQGKNPAGKNH